ncbi:sugar transferase [Maritimibacter sp. DP1N21-5]|uniref:sugar transferase n=1 Tax=Maritimibacter sp. DP1N21-5 TaxID=2836867 RepID=UPI001C48A4A2|nr:sugar transferase [Maritimibacter sp. DP1N21-5]MBV7408707.1 sugar transferase [Maritimibacter sp. DP1N21-5]
MEFDATFLSDAPTRSLREARVTLAANHPVYWKSKRVLDVVIGLCALPFVFFVALALLVLNPFFNRGSLLFSQTRVGRDLKPFTAYKFRTMTDAKGAQRAVNDPVEAHRITPLGRLLRKVRFDELPQFFNILIGDMSFIGPRPDIAEHVAVFIDAIPEYRARHQIRPGLAGLAQVQLGYATGIDQTRMKARADLTYIRQASLWLDLKIVWLTLVVIVRAKGQ